MGFLDKFKSLFGGGQKEEKPAAEVQEPVPVAETPAEEIAAEEPASSGKYYTLACSHVGFSHTKTGTPCQDYTSKVDEEDFHILTVSDGHGSSNFVRSDRGSRFACEAAEAAMRQFAAEIDPAELTADRRRYEALLMLCKNILLRWDEAIKADVAEHPFTEMEVAQVSDKYRDAYLQGERIEHAYGATLIAVLLTKDYMLALRNGDGECVVIDPKGELSTPIPWNEKCEASVVTSLCDKNAIMDFRFHYTTELPAAVFIGSDGIDNSYPKTEDLYTLYCNICTEAVANGIETARTDIIDFLPTLTEKGSQDDVSIAAILDRELLPQVNDELKFYMEHRLHLREAEDTRRKLARINRNIREKQQAQEVALTRATENRSELESLTLQKWSIPGLEFSEDELDGLRQGIKAFEDKIVELTKELEELEIQKEEVSLKLADILEILAQDDARIEAKAQAIAEAVAVAEAETDEVAEPWANGQNTDGQNDVSESV